MPARFSGSRPRRLLLLLCLPLSLPGGSPADLAVTPQDANQTQENSLTRMPTGLKSSPEPMTTAQTVNRQTWGGSISDHLMLGPDASTPGPDLTTLEFKQDTKLNTSNGFYVEYEVLLSGESGTAVVKNITLDSAVRIELSCKLDDKYSSVKVLQVTWKKGNETIGHINKTENSWSIQLTISDNSKLGSYSCTVKSEEKFSVVFHLQVPKIDVKDKPVITYEGDAAVLVCKSSGYTPISWTWYMTNGSEQIAINDSLLLDKYVINRVFPNVTQLKILKLTSKDDGVYWCEAAFELGKSKGKLKLKVLSLMVPLKPFLAIVAEVVVLVAVIFLFEIYSKRREKCAEVEKEFDQIEQLKSEESNGVENSSTRHRKV
ncbi:embigin isoform X1 [Cygnus olor]|uniref:embigin isoform X1 n=2 Tax=Cygnus olor TaxID=8869 RepID=UPI001ADE0422|nr:embigin isoform X1 [Cygnus olor]